MLMAVWQITLLGRFECRQQETLLERFRTRKTSSLLAYLAYHRQRYHTREELADLFWPDASPELGLKSLGVSLSSLRRVLAPAGASPDSVIEADRRTVRLRSETTWTDVGAFQETLRHAGKVENAQERCSQLEAALLLYTGELLPGFYDEWVFPERERLAQASRQVALDLISLLEAGREYARALPYALRRAQTDPYDEDACSTLMRLYAADGQVKEALRHYGARERLLRDELSVEPEPALQQQAAQLRKLQVTAGASRESRHSKSVSVLSPPGAEVVSKPSTPSPMVRLPLTLTRFFGRETETERLLSLLQDPECRLLTLTGSGGCGKTRLAIETTRRFAATFAGNILFVPLADLAHPSQIEGALRQALQLPEQPDVSPETQIIAALSLTPTLLVLDNLEHLHSATTLSEASNALVVLVISLLTHVSNLLLLTTSRHPLALPGEQEFPVFPLPVPNRPGTPERLLEFASVQMFVDRARLKQPDFQVTTRNADAIAQLCVRLEGIPLAIELAAGWVRVYSPAALLAHLRSSLGELASRDRGLPDRQQTLRAMVGWSYNLLADPEKALLCRLSVFEGGWNLPAAEAICAGESVREEKIRELLTALADKNLVVAEPAEESIRYHLLESVRHYAGERLRERGEMEAMRDRHLTWCIGFAAEALPRCFGPEQSTWLTRLEREYDNLRAGLARSYASSEAAERGLRLAGSLGWFWKVSGRLSEGRQWLNRALAYGAGSEAVPVRTQALHWAGNLALEQGEYAEARDFYAEGLTLQQQLGDQGGIAQMLGSLGDVAFFQGEYASAQALYEERLTLHRQSGNQTGIAISLNSLSRLALEQGKYVVAQGLIEEGLTLWRQAGDLQNVAFSLDSLGNLALEQGKYTLARELYEEGLALWRQLGDEGGIALALAHMGNAALSAGDLRSAGSLHEEALAVRRKLGILMDVAYSLTDLGNVFRVAGNLYTAQSLYTDSLTVWRGSEERRGVAFALAGLVRTLAQEHPERAAQLGGCVATLAGGDIVNLLPPGERNDYNRHIATLQSSLDKDVFTAAWNAGRAMTLQQAVEYALSGSAGKWTPD